MFELFINLGLKYFLDAFYTRSNHLEDQVAALRDIYNTQRHGLQQQQRTQHTQLDTPARRRILDSLFGGTQSNSNDSEQERLIARGIERQRREELLESPTRRRTRTYRGPEAENVDPNLSQARVSSNSFLSNHT